VEFLKRALSSPLVGALAVLGCGGCMLVDALLGGERALVFSHDTHVVGEKLECVSCHETAEVEEAPGQPVADSCAACHDQLDEELPAERRVAALFDAQGFRAAQASALEPEVKFEHLAHVTAVADCAACHRGIDTNEAVDESVAVDMTACVRCHAERALPNDCLDCHTTIDRAWEPPSHTGDWKRLHGPACRRNAPAAADDCFLCHQESSCEACHRVEAPRDHNAQFRLRGHAIQARVERESCATCHEPSTCDRCHAETLPASHRAASFGGSRNTHCVTCHIPLESQSCQLCHAGTPSHALGPPKPGWHTSAMDCRSCHVPGSSLLRHEDNLSNCNLCHP
jgi:hypothetical protein